MSEDDWWGPLVLGARNEVEKARAGTDPTSGHCVLRMARLALVSMLNQNAQPSPEGRVYLEALADALIAIENGVNPIQALGLAHPAGRLADPNTATERATLFTQVGEELDRQSGGAEKPVRVAIETVALRNHCSAEKVRKAWQAFGATEGWLAHQSGTWPPNPRIKVSQHAGMYQVMALWGLSIAQG